MALKKTLMLVVSAVLLIALVSAGAAGAADVSVANEQNLRSALSAGNTAVLAADIVLTKGPLTLKSGTSALDLHGYTLTAAEGQRGIDVGGGSTFTLMDSTGTGKIVGSGMVTDEGAGVYIHGGSTFVMDGGSITGFHTESDGGGVGITDGSFTMNGGTIANCRADGWKGGGGVFVGASADDEGYVIEFGSFTMNGGTITDCEVTGSFSKGGGVYAIESFTMNGGTIANCKATGSLGMGGGVAVDYGAFAMTNGAIADCTAKSLGGGVKVGSDDFVMKKSSITGCTAGDGNGLAYQGITAAVIDDSVISCGTDADETAVYSMSSIRVGGTTELENVELMILGNEYFTLIAEDGFAGTVRTIKLSSAETREENPADWLGKTVVVDGAAVKNRFSLSTSSLYDGYKLAVDGADLVLAEKTGQEPAEDNPVQPTRQSPAPVVGLIAGLGAAALFIRKRF